MLKNIFQFRSKKFLGVDVGTSYIRVVEIKKVGKGLQLENYGHVETATEKKQTARDLRKGNMLFDDEETIASALRSICQEAGITTKEVNFSIPDFSSFFTTLQLPQMSKDELAEAVQYEARPYIPLPISEITLDWIVVEEDPSRDLTILVVAVPNDVIRRYQEVAELAGLKISILESEAFSLVRASVQREEDKQKVIGLIDIGVRSTTCNVVDHGTLKASHSLAVGGNALREVLVKSLNIGYNEAEEQERKYGLLVQSDTATSVPGNKQIVPNTRDILLPLVDSLIEEVKKVFRNFYRNEGKEIQKIILAGGISLLPGFKEYIADSFNKEVVYADPFTHMTYPAILKETLVEKGPSYAIAVGVAMKGLE